MITYRLHSGGCVLRVEGQVLAVLEAAAGEQHRQVLHAVGAGVAQVAAEEHRRPVEQVVAFFLRVLQLASGSRAASSSSRSRAS